MHIFYASRDGHAQRIAERIAARLTELGIAAQPANLAEPLPDKLSAGLIVVVAAVRYGRHLAEADRFLVQHARTPGAAPLVLLSVNLTARKPGKQSAEGNPYLRKIIRRRRLKPVLAAAIAGRLDYPRYTPFDRMMIRFIMLLTGGPTDPGARVEFTDWNQVDQLAQRIAGLCSKPA